MTDENVADLVKTCVGSGELHLCPFTTVDQELTVFYHNQLCRSKSSVGGNRSTRPEYGYTEGHLQVYNYISRLPCVNGADGGRIGGKAGKRFTRRLSCPSQSRA